jgi:hypothetical protein
VASFFRQSVTMICTHTHTKTLVIESLISRGQMTQNREDEKYVNLVRSLVQGAAIKPRERHGHGRMRLAREHILDFGERLAHNRVPIHIDQDVILLNLVTLRSWTSLLGNKTVTEACNRKMGEWLQATANRSGMQIGSKIRRQLPQAASRRHTRR